MADLVVLTEVKNLKGTLQNANEEYVVVSVSIVDAAGNELTVDINRTRGEVAVTMPGALPDKLFYNEGNVHDGGGKLWAAN